MAIIVNGGSDPASIRYNGVNLTAVYARQGQSGSYVQVWPSQFTVKMTGERVVEECGCNSCSGNPQGTWSIWTCFIAATDTSNYQLNGNPPTTVSSWDLINNYGNVRVTMCVSLSDTDGCSLGDYEITIPSCMYTVTCTCRSSYDRSFKEMFPDNYTGNYATNLSDGYDGAWSQTKVCMKNCVYNCFGKGVRNKDCSCEWETCWRNLMISCFGTNWYFADFEFPKACFTNKCFRIQANMANGQTYRTAWCIIHDPPMYCDTFTFTPV